MRSFLGTMMTFPHLPREIDTEKIHFPGEVIRIQRSSGPACCLTTELTLLEIQRWVTVAVGADVKPGYIEAH